MSIALLAQQSRNAIARRAARQGHNYPSFEHHADWAKNKWKPALFVFGFASIGLIVPAFGISFAQWKAKGGNQ